MLLRTPWRSLNGCSLGDALLRVPDCVESAPKVFTLRDVSGGTRYSPIQDPMISTELRCQATSSA
jgi:hypothetical protein